MVDSKWLIFGGNVNNEPNSNIYEIDLNSMKSKIIVHNKTKGIDNHVIESHTAVLVDNSKAMIFGGYIGSQKSNKIFLYSILENAWEEIKVNGKIPSPRCNHSAVFLKIQCIFLEG